MNPEERVSPKMELLLSPRIEISESLLARSITAGKEAEPKIDSILPQLLLEVKSVKKISEKLSPLKLQNSTFFPILEEFEEPKITVVI